MIETVNQAFRETGQGIMVHKKQYILRRIKEESYQQFSCFPSQRTCSEGQWLLRGLLDRSQFLKAPQAVGLLVLVLYPHGFWLPTEEKLKIMQFMINLS